MERYMPFAGPGLWIRTIRERFGPRLTEWMLATITALMGVVLLLPEITFANAKAYAGLTRIFGGNENLLGWVMLLLGLARLIGLVINGARRRVTPRIRQVSAGVGFLIFVGFTYGFAISGVGGLWLALYPVFAAVEIANVFRASHDAGESRAAP